jgi:hypothetical protein
LPLKSSFAIPTWESRSASVAAGSAFQPVLQTHQNADTLLELRDVVLLEPGPRSHSGNRSAHDCPVAFHQDGRAGKHQFDSCIPVFQAGRLHALFVANLRLLLRGWRQQAVEAEVHGGGAVMVGPVVGEGDQCERTRCFAAAPDLNRIAQRGVRYSWHRNIAEVE